MAEQFPSVYAAVGWHPSDAARAPEDVRPALREMGLLFVGLDVIGDYLTEINITSPTCIRELDAWGVGWAPNLGALKKLVGA